jgi:hypothetical protein
MEMFIQALNRNLNLPRFPTLGFTGNYSRTLNWLDRNFSSLEARREQSVI